MRHVDEGDVIAYRPDESRNVTVRGTVTDVCVPEGGPPDDPLTVLTLYVDGAGVSIYRHQVCEVVRPKLSWAQREQRIRAQALRGAAHQLEQCLPLDERVTRRQLADLLRQWANVDDHLLADEMFTLDCGGQL